MKDHNYITILGWMVNKLGLSGNELMVYAMIYGFSQDEEDKYEGSGKYIADSLGITKRQVFTILDNLVKKGYIKKFERFERNLKFCDYAVSLEFLSENDKNKGGEKTSPVMKLFPTEGDEKTSPVVKIFPNGDEKTSPVGGEKTSPHITGSNIYNHTTTTEHPNSSEKPPPEGATAAAVNLSPEDIKQAILALDRSLLLKSDFYSRAAAFMKLHYLDKSYLAWLFKQVELREPNNFDGLFFTLFFAENMVEKFKISQQNAKPPPPTEIKCPVCGTAHDKELDKCPLCSLPKDSSSGDIKLFKKLQVLPPDKRNEYLQKFDDIYKPFDMFNLSEVEKREKMINALDKEYGIGVKNEEPSLCYRS